MAETPLLPAEDGAFGDSDESNDSHELMHLYYDEMPTFGVFDHDEFERFVARERAEAEAEEAGGTTSPDEDEAVGNPLARHACVFATFIIDVLALAAIGWVLYYEVGNYAVFLYGVALSTAQDEEDSSSPAAPTRRCTSSCDGSSGTPPLAAPRHDRLWLVLFTRTDDHLPAPSRAAVRRL